MCRVHDERFLRKDERVNRGRLLVFLGAAPGVGKTYAMLERRRTASSSRARTW